MQAAELNSPVYNADESDLVFARNYQSALAYYREHGDLECPAGYVDDQGIRLYDWCNYLRSQFKKRGRTILTEEQFRMLDALGMRWGSKHDVMWDTYYNCLVDYLRRTGNTDVGATYQEGDIPLGRWYRRQKELYAVGELRQDRAERLLSLDVDLTTEDAWEKKFQLARAYSEAHGGSLDMTPEQDVSDGWLRKWLNEMRLMGEGKRKKKLTEDQKRRLESIGMVFGRTYADLVWERRYQAVKRYVESSGNTAIPSELKDDRVSLKSWIRRQLALMRKGELSADKTGKLQAIGFLHERQDPFEAGFAHAKAYFEEHGNLQIPCHNDPCSDGFDLYTWLHNARGKKKKGKLTQEQIERLEAVGMVWTPKDSAWNEMFEAAKAFAVPGRTLTIPVGQHAPNEHNLHDWYMRQRRKYAEGKLSGERMQKLLAIGAVLEPTSKAAAMCMTEKPNGILRNDPSYLGKAVNG